MEFLVILIALAFVQIWGSGGPVQQDQWFDRFALGLGGRLQQPGLLLSFLVAIPCVILAVLYWWLEPMAYGLLSLLLAIVVLLYSLGRGDFTNSVETYLDSWNQGNFESAFQYASDIGDFSQTDSINDHVALHEQMRRTLFYEGLERWFSVIFWFLLLGPVGALGYRLCFLCGRSSVLEDSYKQLALRMVHYLDWLPARMLAFSFNLAGDFVHGFSRWLELVFENLPALELLDSCGCAALANDQSSYPADRDEFIIFGRDQLLATQSLVSRSVITWLIVIALLQITII
jgi:AmpE protein